MTSNAFSGKLPLNKRPTVCKPKPKFPRDINDLPCYTGGPWIKFNLGRNRPECGKVTGTLQIPRVPPLCTFHFVDTITQVQIMVDASSYGPPPAIQGFFQLIYMGALELQFGFLQDNLGTSLTWHFFPVIQIPQPPPPEIWSIYFFEMRSYGPPRGGSNWSHTFT